MKVTISILFLLAAAVLLPKRAFSQSNYQAAKVTTLTGDTIQGFIDYRGWERNPQSIAFKPSEQASAQTFRPLDIKGFKVNNEVYVSGQVSIEDSPQKLEELSISAAPDYHPDTTFLKVLAAGPKSLYLYRKAKSAREYFYIEQKGAFDLLVYKRYKQMGDGAMLVRSNNQYQQQLLQYLAPCAAIEQRLRTARYDASSLQKLFTAYYAACASQQPAFLETHKSPSQAGILIGATSTTLGFSTSTQAYYPVLDSYTFFGPTGGLFYYVSLPGSLGRFSINNDITFSSFKGTGSSTATVSPDNSTNTSVSLKFSYLKLNTLIRFTQPVGTGAIFINAGISNGYALQSTNEKTVVTKFYTSSTTKTTDAFTDLRRYEQGFVAGIGASAKRLSAEVRYERSNGFLDYTDLGSSFKRYSLLVGYRLH